MIIHWIVHRGETFRKSDLIQSEEDILITRYLRIKISKFTARPHVMTTPFNWRRRDAVGSVTIMFITSFDVPNSSCFMPNDGPMRYKSIKSQVELALIDLLASINSLDGNNSSEDMFNACLCWKSVQSLLFFRWRDREQKCLTATLADSGASASSRRSQ